MEIERMEKGVLCVHARAQTHKRREGETEGETLKSIIYVSYFSGWSLYRKTKVDFRCTFCSGVDAGENDRCCVR